MVLSFVICYPSGNVFSLKDMDTRYIDMFAHKINLNDKNPIKLPHQRIPPNVHSEVREHRQIMPLNFHV